MTTIQYITGDATRPIGQGPRILAHVCNDVGGWGKGIVLTISKRWKEPEAAFRQWYARRDTAGFALGQIQLVPVEPELYVCNMVGQSGLKPKDGVQPVRYQALEQCLSQLAIKAKELQASVHMPRIGCGLAGGTWDKVEPIIRRTLGQAGVEVFVYDLPEKGQQPC